MIRQVLTDEALAEMRASAHAVAAGWILDKSGGELVAEQRR